MRAVSFLPAATSLIQDLGLEASLVGVTWECPSDRPTVLRSTLPDGLSSEEIDRRVGAAAAQGVDLYEVDLERLASLCPDVVFTQAVCNVCQIGADRVEAIVRRLDPTPQVVVLSPHRLADVFDDAARVARALGHPEAWTACRARIEARLARLARRLGRARVRPRRVMVMEWLAPVYNAGHWIPDQVALAGGVDVLARPGGPSRPVDFSDVLRADPEVLLLAPCGLDLDRAVAEAAALARRPGWEDLTAVKAGRVYAVDAHLFTRPSLTLVDGIELLAGLLHPEVIAPPTDGWRPVSVGALTNRHVDDLRAYGERGAHRLTAATARQYNF